jgi:hypothetical protein
MSVAKRVMDGVTRARVRLANANAQTQIGDVIFR